MTRSTSKGKAFSESDSSMLVLGIGESEMVL